MLEKLATIWLVIKLAGLGLGAICLLLYLIYIGYILVSLWLEVRRQKRNGPDDV